MMTLQEMEQLFVARYGERNQLYLDGLAERITFLLIGIKDLQDAIRKSVGERKIAVAITRVVSRIFCISEHFGKLPLAEAFTSKYLMDVCSYCQQSPCTCGSTRPP